MDFNDVFKIGFIARTHGTRGEVSMRFTDDVFDRADTDFLFLKMDGLLVPFMMESYRFKSSETVIMKFRECGSKDDAQRLQGAEVYFEKSEVVERDEEPLTWKFLHGFLLYGEKEGLLGTVSRVDDSNQNILLYVERTDGGELLVPLHPDFVVMMDEENRSLTLRLPEGLLGINE
ncbi:MAG: 16S rRNA processing protein RimM [Bacteroidaceae bacterium]|nr:16S rRNA processing protein RimM [Bacteroidaceae bacterium]